MPNSVTTSTHASRPIEHVAVTVGEQTFGVPIARVRDVFVPGRITRVPGAPKEIAGVLNLRGRIVTVMDMRVRLGLSEGATCSAMAVGITYRDESYALLVDAVGEVLKVPEEAIERNPVNLDPRLAEISSGVHGLEGQLLVVLDIDRVLDIGGKAIAA